MGTVAAAAGIGCEAGGLARPVLGVHLDRVGAQAFSEQPGELTDPTGTPYWSPGHIGRSQMSQGPP